MAKHLEALLFCSILVPSWNRYVSDGNNILVVSWIFTTGEWTWIMLFENIGRYSKILKRSNFIPLGYINMYKYRWVQLQYITQVLLLRYIESALASPSIDACTKNNSQGNRERELERHAHFHQKAYSHVCSRNINSPRSLQRSEKKRKGTRAFECILGDQKIYSLLQ